MRENIRLKGKKILIISTQLRGGCFQYANNIILNWKDRCEIVMPDHGLEEETVIPDWTIKYYGYNQIRRLVSFFYSLLRIACGLLFGRYEALVLFGLSQWDYYYLKLWNITKLKSFAVIHDGKMHDGELCDKQQKIMIDIMKMSTNLIYLSEYVKRLVNENFNIDKPSHIAPHGLIDYGKIHHYEQRPVPKILFLGRVSRYKGVDTLLEAMRLVPSDCYSKLIIAGRWEKNIDIVPSTEKIEIKNKYLSYEEILTTIESCDIMVFPYREATQSGVATLALNYLKPSIVTTVGAFKEQFTERSAVFVEPDNPAEFARSITELCYDLARRNIMVESIKKEKSQFEWQSIAERLETYIITQTKNELTNN